jgi:hypothetical protein
MYGASTATYDHAKSWFLAHTEVQTPLHPFVLAHECVRGKSLLQLKSDSVVTHLASSCVSGLVAASVSAPFDVIKTRIINQQKRVASSSASSGAAAGAGAVGSASAVSGAASEYLYKGPLDCLIKTVKAEGAMALYKGFTPTYMRLAPWQVVFFLLFEQTSILVTGQPFQAK